MVCLAVCAHDAAAVHRQHHMELLQRHILHQHIVAPLQETVIHGKHRYQPLLGHTAGHSHTVALRNAHVKESPRELPCKVCQTCAVGHGGGDGAHAPVLPRQLPQCLAEHMGERFFACLPYLSGSRIKGPYAVELLRLPQCIVVSAALHGVDVYQHRAPGLFGRLQYRCQPLYVVAAHRTHVRKAHILEHGAHRRQQRLFQRCFYLVAPLIQCSARRQLLQCLAVTLLEFVILRVRPHLRQLLGQPAYIPVDGHSVIVQNDHQRFAAAAGVVEALKAQPAAQRTVADNGHHMVVLPQQRPRPCHAQRYRHRIRRVPRHKGVVHTLIGLGKA